MNLLNELEEVTTSLAQLHREYAQVVMAETRGKVESQFWSEEETVTARGYFASFQVIDFTEDRLRLDGEIRALRERKDYLMSALGENSGSAES